MKNSYQIEEITPGMTATMSHLVTESDVAGFANLSGDHNPVHLDDEYASKSRFGKRIAHGLFGASFFSGLFGTRLPGPGCVYASQNLKFRRPVFIGDVLVATICTVDGKEVIIGDAVIFIP